VLSLAAFSACVQSSAPTEQPVAPAPPVAATPAPEKIDLRGVSFDRHGTLRRDSKPVLDAAAELIKTETDAKVYVDAYCDPSGSPTLNQKISKARAAAVKAYLVKQGVPADRVVARGFGATNFIASNASLEGRKENRRIELVIIRG